MLILGTHSSQWMCRYFLGPDHPFKIRLVNNFFRWFQARITVPYQTDLWITLDLSDGVQETILRYGAYEPEVGQSLMAEAQEGDVFWDIGANIGAVSLFAVGNSKIREVHSFEAHPKNFSVLKKNLTLNPVVRAFAHGIALGEREEDLWIYSGDKGNCGASSLELRLGSGPKFRTTCKTVDQVIAAGIAPAPNLLKIDVEGWEMAVLRGAKSLFEVSPPRSLVVEAKASVDGHLANEDLASFLAKRGYQCRHIERAGRNVEAVENFQFTRN